MVNLLPFRKLKTFQHDKLKEALIIDFAFERAERLVANVIFYLTLYQMTKILHWINLKAFTDEKRKRCLNADFSLCRKQYGKRRKCRLPVFFPFPKRFSKDSPIRAVKTWACLVKG